MAGTVRITGNQIQDNAIPEGKLDPEVRDQIQAGLDYKKSCRVATTVSIAILSGGAPSLVDGVPLAHLDRVLVKDQAGVLKPQNGIYFVNFVGGGANGVWLRDSDADSDVEVTSGLNVYISEGLANKKKFFTLTTVDPIVLETTPLTLEVLGGGGGGGGAPIGLPTDGTWDDGFVQGITAATTIADAVDYVNEMMALLHPLPPRLGQVNIVGDGNIFSANYAGGSESLFKNGKIADPALAYSVAPFISGNKELIIGAATPPEGLPPWSTFRTFNPISGLRAGTVLRAYMDSGAGWVPLGDDWPLTGLTAPQSSPLGTWFVYGPGGVPGVSALGTLPNGDLYGYVQFNFRFPIILFPQYCDFKLEQTVGASTPL